MDRDSRCHHRCSDLAAAIATVQGARPGDAAPDAFLAHVAVAEQKSSGANNSEVVQRLDNRDAGVTARHEDRGSEPGKEIVDMNYIRPFFLDAGSDELIRFA